MRKINENEHVEVLSGQPIPDVPIDLTEGKIRGSAVVDDKDAAALAPKPKWYRVIRGGTILENGFRTRMKEGKEINNVNYNIRRLQQQGIAVQEFDPDTEFPSTDL